MTRLSHNGQKFLEKIAFFKNIALVGNTQNFYR